MFNYEKIVERLTSMIETTARMDPGEIDEFENLIELGADSIILTDVNGIIREEFGVEIPMTLFFSDLTSVGEIAAYIYEHQESVDAPEAELEQMPEKSIDEEVINKETIFIENKQPQIALEEIFAAKEEISATSIAGTNHGLTDLFAQQLEVMNNQLRLLSARNEVAATGMKQETVQRKQVSESEKVPEGNQELVNPTTMPAEKKPYVAHQQLSLKKKQKNEEQRKQLEELTKDYNEKTKSSKEYVNRYREVYADWRNIAGFKADTKEMVYQLVFEDSKGSRMTDIDGNEYIDLAMDFGVSLFGHNADFIKEAIAEELKHGFPLSLISKLSGEVAQLISELTGVERVSFFNSGTEAVMVAMRLARAATGKDKIVYFSGSYHGTFDGVLGMNANSKSKGSASPMAGGILQNYVDDLYILDYDHPKSLAFIEEHADEIAAVLVEPVQSRRPELQPREFLHQLRELTFNTGIKLIFDEMILGFRLGVGGAQQYFDIKADLVTYGKIVGGGMPIGIVAGKHEVMDCIDGGVWNYGDDSTPPFENKRTFAGGTFCHHPLAMAAAKAVLLKIKAESHEIYPALEAKTKYLADTLNAFFKQHDVPAEVTYCGSLFRFVLRGNMELFYYHLLSQGVYVWEGRNCFLSTAHSDEDIDQVIRVVKDTCLKMKTVFFARSEQQKKSPEGIVQLTKQQQEMLASEAFHKDSSAFNQPVLLNIKGILDRRLLEKAFEIVLNRHEALRYVVSENLETLQVNDQQDYQLTEINVTSESENETITELINTSIDFMKGPLIKVYVLQSSESNDEQLKLFVLAHHLIMDGWSISVFCEEWIEAYNSLMQGRQPIFNEAMQFSDYLMKRENELKTISEGRVNHFWKNYLFHNEPRLFLPQHEVLNSSGNRTGSRLTQRFDLAFIKKVRKLAAAVKSSPFTVLLTAYQFMLREISQQNNFFVGVPIAGQQTFASKSLIGDCSSILPIAVQLTEDSTIYSTVQENVKTFKEFEAIKNGTLSEFELDDDLVLPEMNILFNMDRVPKSNDFFNTTTELMPVNVNTVGYDLFFNITEFKGEMIVDIDFNTTRFTKGMVARWLRLYIEIIEQICERPNSPLLEFECFSAEDEEIRRRAIGQVDVNELAQKMNLNIQEYGVTDAEFQLYVLNPVGKPVITDGYGSLYLGRNHLEIFSTGWIARLTSEAKLELYGPEERCFYRNGRLYSLWFIENVLAEYSNVREVTISFNKETQNLTAYLSLQTDEFALGDFQAWCQGRLPFHLIPDTFYRQDNTEDKAVLLEYEKEAMNDDEVKVFEIVKDLVGIEHFHKNDNLISVGLNSLNMLKMLSKIQQAYNGVRMPMTMLTEELTVKNIAEAIQSLRVDGQAEIIPKVAKQPSYETSSAQQRMYVIHKLNSDSFHYNLPSVVKVSGKFDVRAFQEALNTCLQRHEILRTSYTEVDGEIVQIVHDLEKLDVEWKEMVDVADDQLLIKQVSKEFIRPFDLATVPLMRACVVKRNEQHHFIFLDFHHIAFDGTSSLVLAKEILALYSGEEPAKLPIQYKDFAMWQNECNRTQVIRSQEQYWVDLLKNAPLASTIPTDAPRQVARTYQGNTVTYQLDQNIKEQITSLCKEQQCTPYVFFMSALNALLSNYSGQSEVIVGTLVQGRNHPDLQEMIGMFVNTLPIVNSVEQEQLFTDLLKAVRQTTMTAFANAEVPFERMVELSEAKIEVGRNPLFDLMFSYQDFDPIHFHTSDASFEYQELLPDDSKFDLEFEVISHEDGYSIVVQYATDLYKEEQIQRLMGHFVTLINQFAKEPMNKLSHYQMLTTEERNQLLHFNDPNKKTPNQTLIDLFEEWVAKAPNRTAIVHENEQVTYQQLNEQANLMAHFYLNIGIQEEEIVGIMLERTPQMISSVVGAWKAGGAYLPLDLAHPVQRRVDILHEANVKFVVTLSEHIEEEFRDQYNGQIIYLDQIPNGTTLRKENLNKSIKPSNLAYILFTSGSTGKPKGVMIEHRGILNHILAEKADLGLDESLVFAQNANQTFDISVWQLFGPLALGGRTVIYSQEVILQPKQFVNKVMEDGITLLEVVPSYLTVMLDYIENHDLRLKELRYLMVTGETVKPHLVKRWFEACPDIEVINAYGPAEASDDISQYRLTSIDDSVSNVPIGKPLNNVRIYIMDAQDRLCPVGVAGELCVAGISVGRGYINDPERTKQTFCEDPFVEKGERYDRRMYRTGDLGRWLPDGNIEYLGRMDDQVKIRGFRIELGEVENAIKKQENIQEVAVVVKSDQTGELALCAYIVHHNGEETSKLRESLKGKLRRELPEYMIPSYFIEIDNLPVTRNGKLDKRALPDPDFHQTSSCVAPRTETERALAQIFQEVLGAEAVSVDDHFFELGGHSLKAIKAINLIEASLGVRLPLTAIFTYPTVEQLSEQITNGGLGVTYQSIPKADERAYYPVSSQQKRLYIISEIDDLGTVYNMPAVIEFDGPVDYKKIQAVCQTLVDRHEALRTSFHVIDGEPVQKVAEVVEVEVEYQEINLMDYDTNHGEWLQFIRPFDLAKAPLFRVKLINAPEKSLLLFDMHHIISDGESINLLTREFSELYNGNELAKQERHYKDYSEWMRKKDLQTQKDYWLEQFADEVPVLDLPTDYSRPRKQSFNGARLPIQLDQEMKEAIHDLCQRTNTTEYMVFLSAFMVLLHKYSRQEDIVVGSPISGRTHHDTEEMLGMFVNTLPMRGKPVGTKNFAQFLEEIKEMTLKAYENQEYPFEDLVENVDVGRDMSRNPIFDCVLVLQNQDNEEVSFAGTAVKRMNDEINVAKFDLTVNIKIVESGYVIDWEYCTDLFTETTVQRIANHFRHILNEVTRNEETLLREVKVVTAEEQRQILVEFNPDNAVYPQEETIKSLFEQQVKKTPNHTAVVYKDEQITYEELNRRANTIARNLIKTNRTGKRIVAVMLDRSINMIATLLGIAKAGHTYLPIDPDTPVERIKFILQDSKAALLLIDHEPESDLHFEGKIIRVANLLNDSIGGDLDVPLKPSDSLYIIYTSGTTGNPKGVLIEHRNVVRLLKNSEFQYDFSDQDVWSMFHSYQFDFSVWEMYGALLNGGKLIVIPKSATKDSYEFLNILTKEKVTVLNQVPSSFYELMQAELTKETLQLQIRHLIFGGETLNPGKIRAWYQRYPQTKIVNMYGITETTVHVTYKEIKQEEMEKGISNIGKAIPTLKVYVMNEDQLCGIGMPGEICVAGAGVAKGYINRSELTAAKFVENPFVPGEKMYRSGDLARWLPDGSLEYLGRIDNQVKIRGYRIELGEIENAIRKLANIHDVAVLTQNDPAGDPVLCAYVVGKNQQHPLDPTDLLDGLRHDLPEYMIPLHVYQLDKLPITSNGKLDRRGLPKLQVNRKEIYVAPRNELEKKLAEVFSYVLGIEKVGIEDNFFELGGDSIKAIRVISKLREEGYDLTVKDLIFERKIRLIAYKVKKANTGRYTQEEVVGPLPLTPIQHYFYHQKLKKPHHYNQAILLKAADRVDLQGLRQSLAEVVKHHDSLRTVFTREGTQQILSSKESKLFDLEIFDHKNLTERLDQIIEEHANQLQESIDLMSGPMVKAGLFKTRTNDYLFLCVHHLVIDGVSWRVLLEDLQTGYQQYVKGEPIKLPMKTASYKEWAEALKEYAVSDQLKPEVHYWQEVSEYAQIAKLQVAQSEGESQYKTLKFELDKEATMKLLFESSTSYNTEINDLLLTALGRSIYKWTGQTKVAIELEGHGREGIHQPIEIDRTVGWFTSLYPVVLNTNNDIELDIISTKEMIRRIPNNGFGYGVIKYLGNEELPKLELDLCFNFLGQLDNEGTEQNLFILADYPVGESSAKENRNPNAITINASVVNDKLVADFIYDEGRFTKEQMIAFESQYKESLNEIIDHCTTKDSPNLTASDFGDLELEMDELDEIMKHFN